jgi:hypothetical protein
VAEQPYNKPSVDPADEDNMAGLFRHVFAKLMQGVDGMLPAVVVAFNGDRDAPRVTVQPQIALVTTGGAQVSRAQIASLPVFQFGAGGFLLSFPIKTGDFGWILANDRDISVYLQSGELSRPQTFRKQNFADAIFIPDAMRNYAIADEDVDNPVFQSADGSVRIALWEEFVKLNAPRGLGINTVPDANTILHVASTTKASIPAPRMTTTQRNAIPNPQEGMTIWNLTTHTLQSYNGTTWP